VSSLELLVGNPRRLSATIAEALAGQLIMRPGSTVFASSEFDPFLNQTFVAAGADALEAVAGLEGRPTFVWLDGEPAPLERAALEADRFVFARFFGMTS
jgi:hypothetical protein